MILWGLSQGCAAGIFTLLGGWSDITEPKALGAFIGMSGWLPFEQHLNEILHMRATRRWPETAIMKRNRTTTI